MFVYVSLFPLLQEGIGEVTDVIHQYTRLDANLTLTLDALHNA
jgi:hypothetical protein